MDQQILSPIFDVAGILYNIEPRDPLSINIFSPKNPFIPLAKQLERCDPTTSNIKTSH